MISFSVLKTLMPLKATNASNIQKDHFITFMEKRERLHKKTSDRFRFPQPYQCYCKT